jgi:hypothetical protein
MAAIGQERGKCAGCVRTEGPRTDRSVVVPYSDYVSLPSYPRSLMNVRYLKEGHSRQGRMQWMTLLQRRN